MTPREMNLNATNANATPALTQATPPKPPEYRPFASAAEEAAEVMRLMAYDLRNSRGTRHVMENRFAIAVELDRAADFLHPGSEDR